MKPDLRGTCAAEPRPALKTNTAASNVTRNLDHNTPLTMGGLGEVRAPLSPGPGINEAIMGLSVSG